ncbi:MAG: hypothetical protein ACR2M7_02945, partial [Bdellovibrionales bacterium]
GYKRKKNKELLARLSHTTVYQAYLPSLKKDKNNKMLFQDKCVLFNDQEPFLKKAKSLENIFNKDNSGFAFFAIEHFLAKYEKEMVEGEGKTLFRKLRNNKNFSEKFQSYYKHLDYLPYMKIIYLNILKRFSWIDDLDFKAKLKKSVISLIEEPDMESFISVNLLISDNQLDKRKFYLTEKDLPTSYIKNIWSLLILEQLQYEAPHLQKEILDFCYDNKSDKIEFCYQALNTLAHIKPSKRTSLKALKFLEEKDQGLIFYTLRLLGQSPLVSYDSHSQMALFLNYPEPWIRDEALDALLFIQTPYQDIQQRISKILELSDKKLSSLILQSFSKMEITSDEAMNNIVYYIRKNSKNKNMFKEGLFAFKNTPKLSGFTLDYFYEILELNEGVEKLYLVINLLAQTKTKDRGIYYRIAQLYKESNEETKKWALKNMSSFTWFHPSFQEDLINFLQDEDREVRHLAIQMLKNLENLTEEAHQKILSLKGQNKEIDLFIKFLN